MTSETTSKANFTAPPVPSTSRALDKDTCTTQGQPPSASQDGFPDVAEVRTRVANLLRAALELPDFTDEDTACEDEVEPHRRRKRAFKSGKIQTADTLVTKKITWPHEVRTRWQCMAWA